MTNYYGTFGFGGYSGPRADLSVEIYYTDFDVYNLNIKATREKELREQFDAIMDKEFKPKLNSFQKFIYGDLVKTMPWETLKSIVDNNRGMGKTTAHAMKQIAEAIQNPGKAIKLYNDENSSAAAGRIYIQDVVKPMIAKLGLNMMVVREAQQTLTFEVN